LITANYIVLQNRKRRGSVAEMIEKNGGNQ